MDTSRIALAGLFLVCNVGLAAAQSPPGTTPAQTARSDHEMVDLRHPMFAATSLAGLAPFGVAAGPSGTEAELELASRLKKIRQGGRAAGSRGALIGGAIGSMLGATLAYAGCQGEIDSCSGSFYLGMVAGALPGAGIGALIGHQLDRGMLARERAARRRGAQ